jgi:hypothetical protein
MTSKAPLKDMIIILPGILGSVLKKDGRDLWAISGDAIWDLVFRTGETIKSLKLEQDDPEAEDLGDGVRPTALIQDTHLVPGLWKIDGYTRTAKLITDNFDVTPGDIYNDPDDRPANFYQFPYDWRRDNRANARILKKLVDKRLKCWRERSGAADARVILMAHSMGGLVSRYYLEVLEGWRDSRALFTFGTPYRGSLNAVNFLANGYKKLFLDLTDVMRSLTSIYQLLPIYQCVNINGEYSRIAEADSLPNINKAKAQDALAFHREIEAAVDKHLQDTAYRSSFSVVPIAGVNQPTLQSATLLNGLLTATRDLPAALQGRADLGDGDGTVPKVSAIPIERSSSLENLFIAEQHGAIQNQPQVLENLLNTIRMSQFNLAAVKAPQKAISLSLDDVYTPEEEVVMQARLMGVRSNTLKATIESVSGASSPIHHNFVQRGDEWVLSLDDLPTGFYRVTVSTEDLGDQYPSPVHGLFGVMRPEA